MGPLVGAALVGGAAQLIGSGISSAGQAKANKMNLKIAREQMAFQERMRNSEWQAGVKDMQLAGLNPALAYEKGGASSPAGASARMENTMAGLGDTVSQVSSIALQSAQARKTTAEAKYVEAETLARIALLKGQLQQTGMNTARAVQDLRFNEETFGQRSAGIMYDTRLKQLEAQYGQDTLDPRVAAAGLSNEFLRAQTAGQKYQNQEAKVDADFWRNIGSLPDWVNGALQLIRLFKGRR